MRPYPRIATVLANVDEAIGHLQKGLGECEVPKEWSVDVAMWHRALADLIEWRQRADSYWDVLGSYDVPETPEENAATRNMEG